MRIGIPKSLFFYYYGPLWQTFFEQLGYEVIFSPPTSKAIVERGIGLAVDEACLPIKAFYGHIDFLKNEVEYLFIPRLISIAPKEYICPKFMGLPDMIKQKIKNLPTVVEPTIDCSKSAKQMEKVFLQLGAELGSPSRLVKMAWQKALLEYRNFKQKIHNGEKYLKALGEKKSLTFTGKVREEKRLKIGLIGHGYNIYDYGISMELIERLESLSCEVKTAENLTEDLINDQAARLPKRMFWTLGKKAFGSAMHWVQKGGVDGIVYLSTFGCGPDSLVGDLIERYCRKNNFPILYLTIDEHTGEAGVTTRIEAFIDLLERRNVS